MRMSYPEEIADMTVKYMNHIKTLVLNSNEESLVKSAIQKLIVKYDLCKSAGFFRIKIELLNCLQGKNSKISTMLKSGVQLADGNFMIDNSHASPGTQRPGDVSIFTNGSLRSQINFVLCLTNKYQANSTSIRRSNVEISRYHIVDQKESIPISSDSLRVSIAR